MCVTIPVMHNETNNQMVDALIARYGGPRVELKESFTPTRYPYTYACDYFRQNVTGDFSRGEASGLIREHAERAGIEADELFIEMADRYLRAAGVVVSDGDKADAMFRRYSGRNTAT
jgi:hypothetical protein